MYTLMTDPVTLPSGQVMDRKNIGWYPMDLGNMHLKFTLLQLAICSATRTTLSRGSRSQRIN
jgi:hypothetical protein